MTWNLNCRATELFPKFTLKKKYQKVQQTLNKGGKFIS